MTFSELCDILKNNGVVGAGGAGFPSYAKLNDKADTIILNCAECEPLLKVHRQLLEKYSYEILSALNEIAKTLGVNDVFVAVKSAYQDTIESLNSNLDSFKNIKLKILSEFYPAGDEVILVYETTGRRIEPGKIPASVGTIVFNVETVYNIYNALKGVPVTDKFLTVAGEVNNPVTLKVPLGVTFEKVISMAGGAKLKEYSVISGGPMTGSIANKFDTVKKTTNAILVLPKNHKLILKKNSNVSIDIKRIMSVCCQCRTCTDLCTRNLLGHPIEPHMIMRTMADNKEFNSVQINSLYCSGCGVCEMYACMQGLSPRKIISILKSKVRSAELNIDTPVANAVFAERDYRKIPVSRLVQRLGLVKYDISAPLSDRIVETDRVKIFLSQSIGGTPLPVVKINEKVKRNQLIAVGTKDSLSVSLHSSVDGKVVDVNEKYIIIDCQR